MNSLSPRRVSRRLRLLGSLLSLFALIASPAAAQRFDTDGGFDAGQRRRNDSLTEESSQEESKTSDSQILLREGTRIPAAVGRIVPVGRRWGFAPANAELFKRLQATHARQIERSLARQAADHQRPTRLGSATILVRGPDLTRYGATDRTTEADENRGQGAHVQHILLVENLMLQRIVEAVIQDSSDDRWSITGEIFEFRNQNRLLIRTAQRASSR